MKKLFAPLFLLLTLTLLSATSLVYAYDDPVAYTGVNYQIYENINLVGNGTGTGLTVSGSSHNSFYNVHIENFSIGIFVDGGLANNWFNVQIINNVDIGVQLSNDYGVNRFFGGSISSNKGIGVQIDEGSIMNQFFGTEIEVNNITEVSFNGNTYGNLFEGVYFERTASTQPQFFTWTNALGSNTFYSNKFATQGNSTLEIAGDSNIFRDNIFDSGTVTLTITGDSNIFRDNRQGMTNAIVNINDNGVNTIFQANIFSGESPPLLTEFQAQIVTLFVVIAIIGIIEETLRRR